MLQVDPIQRYLNLKIGLPLVLKAGSSGIFNNKSIITINKKFSIVENKIKTDLDWTNKRNFLTLYLKIHSKKILFCK